MSQRGQPVIVPRVYIGTGPDKLGYNRRMSVLGRPDQGGVAVVVFLFGLAPLATRSVTMVSWPLMAA
jgi:hypothetical protein